MLIGPGLFVLPAKLCLATESVNVCGMRGVSSQIPNGVWPLSWHASFQSSSSLLFREYLKVAGWGILPEECLHSFHFDF